MKQKQKTTAVKSILLVIMTAIIGLTFIGCGAQKPRLSELKIIRQTEQDYRVTNTFTGYYYCDINYDDSSFLVDGNNASCSGTVDIKFNEYFRIEGDAESDWYYNKDRREWRFFDDDLDIYGVLDINAEGCWQMYDDRDCIYVKNQTDTGMDIYVEGYSEFGDDWVHVKLKTWGENDLEDELRDGACHAVYTGENADGNTVEVIFYVYSSDDDLNIQVDAGGFGSIRWGRYDDFIPAD